MRFLLSLVACLGLVPIPGRCEESTKPTPYSLPSGETFWGSNVPRPSRVTGSSLPFDKRYAELTHEQQLLVKSQYEAMAEEDEPPFPLSGLRNIYKNIAAAQLKLLVTGDLSMFVEINSEGKATSVAVYKSPSSEMTQIAATVLMLEPYKPAVCSGKPCAMAFPFRVKLIVQ